MQCEGSSWHGLGVVIVKGLSDQLTARAFGMADQPDRARLSSTARCSMSGSYGMSLGFGRGGLLLIGYALQRGND